MATASIVSRVSIGASPKTVFKYLSDPSYHFLWNPHLRSLAPGTPLKLGSKYKTTSMLLGVTVHSTNEVTVFVPNQEIQVENDSGTLKYKIRYSLQSKSGHTQLTCNTEVSADGPAFGFGASLLKLLARRELRSDLNALKIASENKLS